LGFVAARAIDRIRDDRANGGGEAAPVGEPSTLLRFDVDGLAELELTAGGHDEAEHGDDLSAASPGCDRRFRHATPTWSIVDGVVDAGDCSMSTRPHRRWTQPQPSLTFD